MEGVLPGERRPITLTNLPAGLVGTLGVRIEDDENNIVQARTTEGITEFAAGNYRVWVTFPDTKGFYYVIADDEGVEATEEFRVTNYAGTTVGAGQLYATADGLRAFLKVNAEVLPDEDAGELLGKACDLIDERIGNRMVIEATGRKIPIGAEAEEQGIEEWRLKKLAEATIEIAAVIFHDPGVESRQRTRSVSGDVSTSSPYGPAYGERAQALLTASGLTVPFARVGRRRSGAAQTASRFFSTQP